MKYGIISDIHSNIQALDAALDILDKQVQKIICLGDIVGYNANPSECVERIRGHKKITHVIQGNHDEMALRSPSASWQIGPWGISKDAYDGICYSNTHLSDEQKEWLYQLQPSKEVRCEYLSFLLSHGSPYEDINNWDYVLSNYDAQKAIKILRKKYGLRLGFCGHSHYAAYAEFVPEKNEWTFYMGQAAVDNTYALNPKNYYLFNPGAIGQPRRGKITSFIIFDTDKLTVEIQSFQYDWRSAMNAVYSAGYSKKIAGRLDNNEIEDSYSLRPEYQ